MKDIDEILKSLVTPRFLELVEKWSRYEGDKFYIGDVDVSIENMGTFKKTDMIPKFDIINGDILFDESEMEEYVTFYDVTKITNNCVCSKYNNRILIAERYPENLPLSYKDRHPAKLWIFSIFNVELIDDSTYTEFPSFERLKNDFENAVYKNYQSLLSEFCSEYRIVPFNSRTDRIVNFTGIESDLEYIECCVDQMTEEAKKLEIVTRNKK
jgi:hypothetical protein